jgi:hypothetical protein
MTLKVTQKLKFSLIVTITFFWFFGIAPVGQAAPGDTALAKWKDNKKGAFALHFDDSTISQADNAVPAMVERGLVGTWYINPGNERYKARKQVWEVIAVNGGQELADHTMTHADDDHYIATYEEAEYEIGENARIIWSLYPATRSKLLSYCSPGGVSWGISKAQTDELMTKYHLIHRPDHKCVQDLDADHMLWFAEGALAFGNWNGICFHGVGGDWTPVDKDEFVKFLDKLLELRDRLWIDGNIAIQKYVEERNSASVSTLEVSSSQIRLKLTSAKDPLFYDEPLTLITEIPTTWNGCSATQSGQAGSCSIVKGRAQYDAIPERGEIVLTPQDPPQTEKIQLSK